jgi:hemerythrin superfamily protein
MSTDAITVLKDDHKRIRKLFKDYTQTGDAATKAKGDLAGKILEELTIHTYLENEVMYPEVRRLMPELEEDILESFEEHHVADVLSAELATLEPQSEHFHAKMTVLIENVDHHIEEEEGDWFPQVRQGLSRTQLREIGARMVDLRASAPRSPAQPSALKKAVDAVIA